MNKLMTILGAFMIASVVLTSCGGGAKADGEKLCDLTCESLEIAQEMTENPTDLELAEKAIKLGTKLNNFSEEMKEKYADDAEGKKEMAAAFLKCPCLK
jgi:DNA repair exonuclease SbcCD nuclease subunit